MHFCKMVFMMVFTSIFLIGCGPQAKSTPTKVAEKPKVESELVYVTLAPKAQRSLQIQTQAVRLEKVQEQVPYTGWIMARPGNEVSITAPAAGYVWASASLPLSPVAGQWVRAGQELFTLKPVLSPVEQIQVATLQRSVASELTKAEANLKVALSEWGRIRDLHQQGLRGQQELDQAKKNLDHAQEDLQSAKDKQGYFEQRPIAITSPHGGTILAVPVSPGQYVAAAAPLVSVIELDPVWIRVPVPEFDFPSIDYHSETWVALKTHEGENRRQFRARPVGLVAQVDPIKHTAELYYQLVPSPQKIARNLGLFADAGSQLPGPAIWMGQHVRKESEGIPFVKDQMVTVQVPMGQKRKECVVPYSALVFDAQGSGWVYLDRTPENSKHFRYERRRVEVGASVPEGVVIRPALDGKERVVISGAAVLFSREFHSVPGGMSEEEDD